MKKSGRLILLIFAGIIACSPHRIARAQTLSIAHPDDPAKKVEYFLEKPYRPRTVACDYSSSWPSGLPSRGRQRFCHLGSA